LAVKGFGRGRDFRRLAERVDQEAVTMSDGGRQMLADNDIEEEAADCR
jgi:hypothetical protein